MEQDARLNTALLSQLQCIILPGKHPPKEAASIYDTVYRFWHENWAYTFKHDSKEKVPDVLYSDDFRRQDQIICLFFENNPIGLFSLDWINLNYAAVREHSYMRHYPESLLQQLLAQGKAEIIIMSYLLVSRSWRKREHHLPIADILPGFTGKALLESSAACSMGITRNDVKVNELVMRHGFQPHGDLTLFGREATIMIMPRNHVIPCGIAGVDDAINHLWQHRLDFTRVNTPVIPIRIPA